MRGAAVIALSVVLLGCEDPSIREAETAVKALLRDPESAKFSDVKRCGQGDAVSGKVNSKNGFGGYGGDKYFVYAGGVAATQEDADALLPLMDICMKASAPTP